MNQNQIQQEKPKRRTTKRGRWTNDEESLFEEGLQFYGKDWKKVQRYIKTRTLLQVRSHAQKYFLRLEKIQNTPSHTTQKNLRGSGNLKINFFDSKQQPQPKFLDQIKIQIKQQSVNQTTNQNLTSSEPQTPPSPVNHPESDPTSFFFPSFTLPTCHPNLTYNMGCFNALPLMDPMCHSFLLPSSFIGNFGMQRPQYILNLN